MADKASKVLSDVADHGELMSLWRSNGKPSVIFLPGTGKSYQAESKENLLHEDVVTFVEIPEMSSHDAKAAKEEKAKEEKAKEEKAKEEKAKEEKAKVQIVEDKKPTDPTYPTHLVDPTLPVNQPFKNAFTPKKGK